MPNLVSLTLPSLQILDKTQGGVFPISGFLVKRDNVKKYWRGRSVTKLCKLNLPINGWFSTILNPDFRCMVYGSYIFTNSNFLSYKQNLKISNTALILLLWVKVLIDADFLQKNAEIGSLKIHMCICTHLTNFTFLT